MRTNKIVVATLVALFLMSMSTSFVAAELKHAGKYTFQAEGYYTIEYILPYDASFYPKNYSGGHPYAYGWSLFIVDFEDAKERKIGCLAVYHLNKSCWQEWQRGKVSPSENFDKFVEWFDKSGRKYKLPEVWGNRETTASGYKVVIFGDDAYKSFWIRADDNNGFVIEADQALCTGPYPPRDCPDPKLFWEIVDEFVQSFTIVRSYEPTPTPRLTPVPSLTSTPTPTIKPTPTLTPEPPGFEAVFAIAGLLAVAYLVLRRRK